MSFWGRILLFPAESSGPMPPLIDLARLLESEVCSAMWVVDTSGLFDTRSGPRLTESRLREIDEELQEDEDRQTGIDIDRTIARAENAWSETQCVSFRLESDPVSKSLYADQLAIAPEIGGGEAFLTELIVHRGPHIVVGAHEAYGDRENEYRYAHTSLEIGGYGIPRDIDGYREAVLKTQSIRNIRARLEGLLGPLHVMCDWN